MQRSDTTAQLQDLADTLAGILKATDSTVQLDLQAIWTAGEVCAYYRIGRDTLRGYMVQGLPYLKLKGGYRFERLRVKKFFERQRK